MRVAFKTTVSDGAYTVTKVGGPKLPPKNFKEALPGKRVPPKGIEVKTGTTFGVELGRAYVVNKKGEVTATEDLPIESFTQQLNAPGIRPGPVPLPVPPVKN
jgi:hypothetical protein